MMMHATATINRNPEAGVCSWRIEKPFFCSLEISLLLLLNTDVSLPRGERDRGTFSREDMTGLSRFMMNGSFRCDGQRRCRLHRSASDKKKKKTEAEKKLQYIVCRKRFSPLAPAGHGTETSGPGPSRQDFFNIPGDYRQHDVQKCTLAGGNPLHDVITRGYESEGRVLPLMK